MATACSSVPPSDLLLTKYGSITTNAKDSRSVNVFEYSATSFSCKSVGSRPTSRISWVIGSDDDLGSTTSMSTTNEADQDLRDTNSTLQFIPKRRHHNQLLQCVASAGMNQRQTEVRIIVNVPPSDIRLTAYGSITFNATGTRSVIVFEDSATSFTCTSVGSRPTALIAWSVGSDDDLGSTTSASTPNEDDQGLRDTKSTIQLIPKRRHHNQLLRCVAYAGMNQRQTEVKVIIYAYGARPPAVLEWSLPDDVVTVLQNQSDVVRADSFISNKVVNITPSRNDQGKNLCCVATHPELQTNRQLSVYLNVQDNVQMTIPDDLHDGIETNVSCIALNGYPAPLIHWYIGSTNVTHDSSLNSSTNVDGRYNANSTLTLIPTRFDHGKLLLCQAVQPTTPAMRTQLSSDYLHITLSKTIPECETRTSSEVTIRNPQSEDQCDYKCVAVSRYGSGSAVFNSTFALPPSDLRFTATETRSVIVVENSATSFTCKSIGSHPTALISWTIGSDDDLGSTTSTSTPNEADQGLRDTESTLQLIPKRGHHNQLLRCVAYAGMNQRQTEVRVIVYAPPSDLFISDDRSPMGYPDNPYITMTAGEPRDITCTVRGARPPALIEWRTDAEHIQVMDQVNVVEGQSYVSRRETTITPSNDYHNRIIRCLASRRELQNVLQATILFNIQVVITCKCVGSRPVAILFWELGDTVVTDGITSSVTPNNMDESLFEAENTPQMSGTGDLQAWMSAAVTCIANNGYPAPVFQWYLGTTDLTNQSATEKELNEYNRMSARSVLTFTPKKSDHDQYLVCEVFQPGAQPAWSRSVRKTIEISYPPVIVGLSARRSVTGDGRVYALFTCRVDARPQARIFEWFFNGSRLENDTKMAVYRWDFQETETVTTSTLMISNPKVINEGKYKCLATTKLGNDSAVIYFNFSSCRGELQVSIAAKDLLVTGEDIQLSCLYSFQSSEFLPPANLQIQAVGHTIRNETGTARLTIFENTLVTIICRSLGSRPVSSISWTIGTRRLPHKTFSASSNSNDDTLFDSEGVLELRPDRTDHYKFLRCTATARDHKAEAEIVFIVNGPPDTPRVRGINNLKAGSQSTLTCTSNNGYPTPLVHWYLGSKNVTQNSSVQTYLTDEQRVFTLSNITFVPTRYNHGHLLVCEVLHFAPPYSWTKNKTDVLNIAYPPRNITISVLRIYNHEQFLSVEFICTSDANPPALNFYWYLSGTILTNTTRLLIHAGMVQMRTISTTTLAIDKVQPSDSGKYECQVTTDIGNDTASLNYTNLVVMKEPPSSSKSPPFIEIDLGVI
eukprot:XP_011674693.1 PREDICTED: uncharacterized protein LOC105443342 [Strongylocentrotus purpuratus]